MNNGLRVLILTLEELDPETLKCLWRDHVELRKYFVGVTMNLNGKELTLFSEDFCQAVFTNQWHFRYSLARVLMSKDHIDYAICVIRQTGIDDAMELADLVMHNGRKAALDALPQRELVLKKLNGSQGFLFSFVSYELYQLTNQWNRLFKGAPGQGGQLVFLVESAIRNHSSVMIDWIQLNVRRHRDLDKQLFKATVRPHRDRLRDSRRSAEQWGYAPAISLVLFLLRH